MKGITLHQPYASALAFGLKTFETRSWKTNYRGPLAIHAGMGDGEPINYLGPGGLYMQFRPKELPHGVILAVVDLAECTEMDEVALRFVQPLERSLGDWQVGRFAWGCSNLRALKHPIPFKGKQGLWTVPPGVEREIERQLA